MNRVFTVRLTCGTIGTINEDTIDGQHADDFIGETVNVHLRDENGNPIEVEGAMAETIDEQYE